ncbi:SgcJ/EcaC family oxidoreductase [Luedemannella helvata]|uniref:SgcJ/EcaC family oxidoreductase n=1 Tax=Luedemannella helvata TaxID=349315 RepID=A0ABN2JXV5_9ACTN
MSDTEMLTGLVATIERTQRAEDVVGFLALFDPDAVWVTGGGRRLIGRTAIAEFTRAVLPGGMAGGSVTYKVEHIAFITDDVAVTGVNQQYTGPDGRPTGAGLPTYVWRRAGGTWRIVVGQNTTVA